MLLFEFESWSRLAFSLLVAGGAETEMLSSMVFACKPVETATRHPQRFACGCAWRRVSRRPASAAAPCCSPCRRPSTQFGLSPQTAARQFYEDLPEAVAPGQQASSTMLLAAQKPKKLIWALTADGGASFFENLPEAVALGEQAHGISRSTTLSPRSPRPGAAEDAGVAGAAEVDIQRALLVGNYAAALDACLAVRPTRHAPLHAHVPQARPHRT